MVKLTDPTNASPHNSEDKVGPDEDAIVLNNPDAEDFEFIETPVSDPKFTLAEEAAPSPDEEFKESKESSEFVLVDVSTDFNFNDGAQVEQSRRYWQIKLVFIEAGRYSQLKLIEASPYLKQGALLAAAGIPPIALAVNAFCAFPHIKVTELIDKIKDLNPGMIFLCSLTGTSSFAVNSILNYATIPPAFNMFYDRMWVNFKKHPYKNSAIFLLSAGAAVSTGMIGYSAFISFGKTLAWANFATNGFIFFVTRFYGLVNALHRFEKWSAHRFESNPVMSRTFSDLLSHVTDECAQELEAFLRQQNTSLDEKTMVALLKKLDEILRRNPHAVKSKSQAEILGIVFDIALAAGAGLAVLTIFGQAFLNGLDKLIALCRGDDKVAINNFYIVFKILLSSFSLATPILYGGQTLLLRQTATNAYHSIRDPNLSPRSRNKKIAYGAGLFVSNALACTSIFNLTESTIKDPNYFAAALTSPDSIAAIAHQTLGAAGAFCVNTKLSVEKALPPPKDSITPVLERIQSSANIPSLLTRQTTPATPSLATIPESEDEGVDEEDATPIPDNILDTDGSAGGYVELVDPTSTKPTKKLTVVPPATPQIAADEEKDDFVYVGLEEVELEDATPVTSTEHVAEANRWLQLNTFSIPSIDALRTYHNTLFSSTPPSSPEPSHVDSIGMTSLNSQPDASDSEVMRARK